MAESIPKTKQKTSSRNQQDPKKGSLSPKIQPSRKHNRKSENPTRIPTEQCASSSNPKRWNSLICKNSACRAVLSVEDTFCKRCSCCICHLFDDNKDPSLWLECSSDSVQQQQHGDYYTCSLSCHIECALQKGKVGVVDLGQLMQLDGSYCCASCGKVSGILGCWKKQLMIAKEARRVDVLCYRINLSYRLLDGTCRFKKLHEIVKEAKTKLETEVGPINGVSTKMARGIVSRLSVANDVHTLCSLAIEEADKWLTTLSTVNPNSREDSLPAACRFLFEEVKSTSVVIVLIELSTTLSSSNDIIKGYKLWYCKTRDETHTNEPVCVVPRSERRVLISSLQPCTEYSFRIVSYTESGDLGHSEAKCFTKSVEIIHNKKQASSSCDQNNTNNNNNAARSAAQTDIESDSGFRVRELGKILRLAWAQERGCLNEKCCQVSKESQQNQAVPVPLPPPVGLDLNVASVPDLNEEVIPLVESSRDDEPGDADRSNDSQNWTNQGPAAGEVPAVDSGKQRRKRMLEETHDCDSTLINGSPLGPPGSLDENFEYCVKIIRWLECEGHIKQEFRLKLLTWFSLRSTEQERRVVNTFIQTLMDDPSSLAGQLVDSFSDILSNKRPRNGFCSKLWH